MQTARNTRSLTLFLKAASASDAIAASVKESLPALQPFAVAVLHWKCMACVAAFCRSQMSAKSACPMWSLHSTVEELSWKARHLAHFESVCDILTLSWML